MNPPAEKSTSRLGLTLLLCFFLGLPAVGIFYFWNDVHAKIEKNSEVQGRSLAEASLAGNLADVKKLASAPYAQKLDDSFFSKVRPSLGDFVRLSDPHPIKSWAAPRDDQMWQFVRYQGEAEFSSGKKKLEWVVTRLYINPDWHLDDMKLAEEGAKK